MPRFRPCYRAMCFGSWHVPCFTSCRVPCYRPCHVQCYVPCFRHGHAMCHALGHAMYDGLDPCRWTVAVAMVAGPLACRQNKKDAVTALDAPPLCVDVDVCLSQDLGLQTSLSPIVCGACMRARAGARAARPRHYSTIIIIDRG